MRLQAQSITSSFRRRLVWYVSAITFNHKILRLSLVCRRQAAAGRAWRSGYLVINAFFGASLGDHSLNDVFRKNSEPVLEPTVSLE
jgi:hypothetical protein